MLLCIGYQHEGKRLHRGIGINNGQTSPIHRDKAFGYNVRHDFDRHFDGVNDRIVVILSIHDRTDIIHMPLYVMSRIPTETATHFGRSF